MAAVSPHWCSKRETLLDAFTGSYAEKVAAKELSLLWWEVVFFLVFCSNLFLSCVYLTISPLCVQKAWMWFLFTFWCKAKGDTAKCLNLMPWTNPHCVLFSVFLLFSCFTAGAQWLLVGGVKRRVDGFQAPTCPLCWWANTVSRLAVIETVQEGSATTPCGALCTTSS